MQKEILKRYHTLSLFDCGKRIMEKEGVFPLVDKWGHSVHITLRDTVVHPNGWAGTKLVMDFVDFSDTTVLSFCFGKPFANDIPTTAKKNLIITRSKITLDDIEYEYKSEYCGSLDIQILENEMLVCGNAFKINDLFLYITIMFLEIIYNIFNIGTILSPYF